MIPSLIYTTFIKNTVMDAVFTILHSSHFHLQDIKTHIVIKPNILSEQSPPKTTSVLVVQAIVLFLKKYFKNKIIIAEGCCTTEYTTDQLFKYHCYDLLSKYLDVELIDLNVAPSTKFTNPNALFLKEFYKPDILNDCYLISVPTLKGHGTVGFTGSLKNLIGVAPAYCYKVDGHANKFALHSDIHSAIVDINQYVKTNFSFMDASIGYKYHHINGVRYNPPLKELYCSYDPVAIDVYSCPKVSYKKWQDIKYIVNLDGVIGTSNFEVIEC